MITLEFQSHSMGTRFEGKENYRFHTQWKDNSRLEVLSTTGSMHVALVGGGMSAERQVSLTSSKVVGDALVAAGYRVTFVDMGADIASRLHLLKPDVVYNCLHGTYGEDGCLPGILNTMRIPYTHSGVLASALAFDKLQTRNFFMMNDINMAECMVIKKEDDVENDPMPRPYVIKPLRQGSSIGVQVVFEDDDFSFANYAFTYGDQVLVEKYIKGRELHVVVLNGKAIGALETKLLHSCFNDYGTKYGEDTVEYLCPAPLPLYLYNRLLFDSEKVYNSLNCKGPATLDFILEDESRELFALELNTHPEMTQSSIVLKITEIIAGMDLVNVVEAIMETASNES